MHVYRTSPWAPRPGGELLVFTPWLLEEAAEVDEDSEVAGLLCQAAPCELSDELELRAIRVRV